jgi:hypothetical protein
MELRYKVYSAMVVLDLVMGLKATELDFGEG